MFQEPRSKTRAYKMSKLLPLRDLVNERLTAAVEEIFELFERTIAEYEEKLCRSEKENQRKQRLLDEVNPTVLLPSSGDRVQVPSPNPPDPDLNLEITDTEQIKEEPEEQSVRLQEEQQLPGFIPEPSAVCIKTEDSSPILLRHTEHKEETQEQELYISPEPHFYTETEGNGEHLSDNDNDANWKSPISPADTQMETEADGDDDAKVQRSTTAQTSDGRRMRTKSKMAPQSMDRPSVKKAAKRRRTSSREVSSIKGKTVAATVPFAEGLEDQEWPVLNNYSLSEDLLPPLSPELLSTPNTTVISSPATEDLNELDQSGIKYCFPPGSMICEREEQTLSPTSEASLRRPLREGCGQKCKRKCSEKFSEDRRRVLWENYGKLSFDEKRLFVFHTVDKGPTARTSSVGKDKKRRRTRSLAYSLMDDNNVSQRVCKLFYLSTLGYHPHNDSFIFNAIGSGLTKQLAPKLNQRGKHVPSNKLDDSLMDEHIESFHPVISHNRTFLPSDITVKFMHADFLDKGNTCSYEAYRKVVKRKNIIFAKFDEEQCEECLLHEEHEKEDHAMETCESCQLWQKHIDAATESHEEYRSDSENVLPGTSIRSVDMQKIIMLPRMPGVKSAAFTRRLITYQETFATVGRNQKKKHLSVVWHEGIAGQSAKEVASVYFAALQRERDAKHIVYWVDNSNTHSKNWCLLSSLVSVVNSDTIAAEDITLKYFESGHTVMSADNVNHGVELEMKNRPGGGKVYDFEDFLSVVRKSNSKKVEVVELTNDGVLDWVDGHCMVKRRRMPDLADIKVVQLRRGSRCMYTKNTHGEEEFLECDFLQNKFPLQIPSTLRPEDKGIEVSLKNDIVKTLCPLMPSTRRKFWSSLPVSISKEELDE